MLDFPSQNPRYLAEYPPAVRPVAEWVRQALINWWVKGQLRKLAEDISPQVPYITVVRLRSFFLTLRKHCAFNIKIV